MTTSLLSAEQFLETRFEFPDSGQWSELVAGVPVFLEPPDLDHGNTILNLSKGLAEWVTTKQAGYPCFDLGLLVGRGPDSVWFPAVSLFIEGTRFAHSDVEATDAVPSVVVELASTPQRREQIPERIDLYTLLGVAALWVIDPREKQVAVWQEGQRTSLLSAEEILVAGDELPDFSIPVAELFVEPPWWSGPKRPSA